MNNQFDEKYWELPSIRLFIERAMDSLRDSKSIILLLPPLIDADIFSEKLAYEIWRSDFSRHDIFLEGEQSDIKPLERLNYEFFPDQPHRFPKPMIEIQSSPDIPDLILLRNFHGLSQAQLKDWMLFLDNWAELAHQNMNVGKRVKPIVAVAAADRIFDILPPRKLFLDYYWWWGFPSALEINLLCRSQNLYFQNDPISTWRERLLSSLSPGDLNLVEHLWYAADKRFIDLINAIKSYPRSEKANLWAEKFPEKLGKITDLPSLFPGDAPPKAIQYLWSRGDIYATIEYGVEFHPSALLARNIEAIRHRLWRSQSELLLPIIDNIRIDMCQELTQKLGSEWPYKWSEPLDPDDLRSVKENPAAAQLGYIVHLLESNSRFAGYRQWLPIARTAKNFRNSLAHYRPIENFENLTSFIVSVLKRNSQSIVSS